MKEFKYIITDPEGMHARPATLFVKEASKYPCSILLHKEEEKLTQKECLR